MTDADIIVSLSCFSYQLNSSVHEDTIVYYMSEYEPGTFTELMLLSSIIHLEVDIITIPIRLMIEFRFRRFKYLTQEHSVSMLCQKNEFLTPSSVFSTMSTYLLGRTFTLWSILLCFPFLYIALYM